LKKLELKGEKGDLTEEEINTYRERGQLKYTSYQT
jgi:hypothetical protein